MQATPFFLYSVREYGRIAREEKRAQAHLYQCERESMSKQKQHLIQLSMGAVCLALYFVLDRFFAIHLLANQYKLSFIPVIVAAVFLGPVWGMAVGGLGDLLSAVLMPMGAYFPGFSIVSALIGLTFGLFCHKKLSVPRIIGAVLVCQGIGGFVLNTLNLAFYYIANGITQYGTQVMPIVLAIAATRAVQAGVYMVAQTAFLLLLMKIKPRLDAALPWQSSATPTA